MAEDALQVYDSHRRDYSMQVCGARGHNHDAGARSGRILPPCLPDQVENMGEPITDRCLKEIMVQGMTDDYKDIKLMMYRDPSVNLDQI